MNPYKSPTRFRNTLGYGSQYKSAYSFGNKGKGGKKKKRKAKTDDNL